MSLLTVQEAIQIAKFEPEKPDMSVVAFRAEPHKVDLVKQMCERESITLSAFLRSCLDLWIEEQCPAPNKKA